MVRCPGCSNVFVAGAAAEPEPGADVEAGAAEAADGPASEASRAPPAPPVPGASIDPEALQELEAKQKSHGSKLVVRIVNTYLVSSRKLLPTIRDAIEANDAKAFVSAAHTLASSCNRLGARRLARLCDELVFVGQRGSCEGASALFNRVVKEFRCVQEELVARFGRRPVAVAADPQSATSPSHAEPQVEAEDEEEDEILAHVLVAEDNEVNRRVAVAILEAMRCRVDTAENGQEAVDQLERSSSYDLVLMDCEMPVLDGLEATRAIRAREAAAGASARRLAIVALTGNDDLGARNQCLAAGMDDHLTKPFTKAQLRDVIDRAAQGAFAGSPAPAASPEPAPPASAPGRVESKPSPAPPVTGAIDDPAALAKLSAEIGGDDPKLVVRLVKTYLTASLKLLSAIREAVDADDPKAFVSAAHTLAASSTQVGARRLASLCEQLASLGQSGSYESAHELVDGISEELGSAQHELTTEHLGGEAASDITDAEGASSPLADEDEDEVLAHVLVAEDDEVNQLVAVAVLESMGCRVDIVEDGQEALEQLEQSFFYDLVLMDCQMPTLDGLETTRAIRRRETVAAYATRSAIRRIAIVALTGNSDLGDRQECLDAGMDDHLTKPFTSDQLRAVIDKVQQGAYRQQVTPESADADLPALAPIHAERTEPRGAGAPAPAVDTGFVTEPGASALPQETASSRNVAIGERPRREPPWQRLLRDPRVMLPWAIGGWVLLLIWVIVELLG